MSMMPGHTRDETSLAVLATALESALDSKDWNRTQSLLCVLLCSDPVYTVDATIIIRLTSQGAFCSFLGCFSRPFLTPFSLSEGVKMNDDPPSVLRVSHDEGPVQAPRCEARGCRSQAGASVGISPLPGLQVRTLT